MEMKGTTRIIRTEIQHFKNVDYGEIKYMNYRSVEKNACLDGNDLVGIYGQNGSGKTAMIEAFDILKTILSGEEISYTEFEGLIGEGNKTNMITTFFIENGNQKYKVEYSFKLNKCTKDQKIQIVKETLVYWRRGASWKTKRSLSFENPFYDSEFILEDTASGFESDYMKYYKNISFLNHSQKLAVLCAQKNISILFNDIAIKNLIQISEEEEEAMILLNILNGLSDFGKFFFQVVKVNQLADINNNMVLPVNVHSETGNYIMQGCLPMFVNGHANIPESMYNQLILATDAINIALKSIIPNLQLDIIKKNEEVDEKGIKFVQIDVYSIRNGKKFLTKYESEGIKRIISLLNYLIAYYNSEQICLVVDELDSGIFEYLLGELLGVLKDDAKGQLIFTSHNLRILEKLDSNNIICTTTNSQNRYIRLQGIEKNNNKRDFYIRAVVLGGQKEVLYDDTDLQSIEYAFRKARKQGNDVEIALSPEFEELLENYSSENLQ